MEALFFVKTAFLLTKNIIFDIIKALFEWRKAYGTKKGGGKPQTYDDATGRYGTPAERKRLKELGFDDTLTKRDWARIYERLGEIKRGAVVEKRENGEMLFPLHKMNEGDAPKIVVVDGTYENPNVRAVIEFQSEEEMFDWLEE